MAEAEKRALRIQLSRMEAHLKEIQIRQEMQQNRIIVFENRIEVLKKLLQEE